MAVINKLSIFSSLKLIIREQILRERTEGSHLKYPPLIKLKNGLLKLLCKTEVSFRGIKNYQHSHGKKYITLNSRDQWSKEVCIIGIPYNTDTLLFADALQEYYNFTVRGNILKSLKTGKQNLFMVSFHPKNFDTINNIKELFYIFLTIERLINKNNVKHRHVTEELTDCKSTFHFIKFPLSWAPDRLTITHIFISLLIKKIPWKLSSL